MTSWKAKYNELVTAAELHLKYINKLETIVHESMEGKLKYLGTLPGRYQGERSIVCSRPDGEILISTHYGLLAKYKSLEEARAFYVSLSQWSDHHDETIRILERIAA